MTHVFLTGATGFIGSHLVRKMLEEDYVLSALARSKEKGEKLEKMGIKVIYGDVTDINSLEKIPDDVEAVIHLAAILKFHHIPWKDYYNVNVLGTENILKVCSKRDIEHVIVTSSTEAIGPVKEIPGDENTLPNPVYDYGKSKLLAEKVAMRFHEEENVPVTIIRPTGVYGPGDTYITLSVIRAVKKGRLKKLPGGGNNYLQFGYVEDIVQGYLKILENGMKTIGETYIITSEDYYTYREAFTTIAEILGVEPPKGSMPVWLAKFGIGLIELWNRLRGRDDFVYHVSVVRDMLTNRVYSIEKAKRELGYRPRYNFKEGMKVTIKWFQENGYI